jgi:crossover junction endodeoxyribonuclease RuvC
MAKMTSRQMWTAKLAGKPIKAGGASPGARPLGASELGLKKTFAGLVLGIDPSLRGTGLALIDFHPGRLPVLLRSRTVHVPAGRPMPVALAEIHRAVADFIDNAEGVRHVALERTIYVQNFQTAQILGAARGAAIAAAALRGMPVFEYAPLRVKQAVAGSGRASKEQLGRTVKSMLGHGRALAFDESDAAGVAICHAFTWQP